MTPQLEFSHVLWGQGLFTFVFLGLSRVLGTEWVVSQCCLIFLFQSSMFSHRYCDSILRKTINNVIFRILHIYFFLICMCVYWERTLFPSIQEWHDVRRIICFSASSVFCCLSSLFCIYLPIKTVQEKYSGDKVAFIYFFLKLKIRLFHLLNLKHQTISAQCYWFGLFPLSPDSVVTCFENGSQCCLVIKNKTKLQNRKPYRKHVH